MKVVNNVLETTSHFPFVRKHLIFLFRKSKKNKSWIICNLSKFLLLKQCAFMRIVLCQLYNVGMELLENSVLDLRKTIGNDNKPQMSSLF